MAGLQGVDHPAAGKFRPNPNETIGPINAWDAVSDAIRYMGSTMTRTEVIEHVRTMDVGSLVLIVKGIKVEAAERQLNPVELHLGTTLGWCARTNLIRSPIEAIGILTGVRQEVLDGGLFVGTERPIEQ